MKRAGRVWNALLAAAMLLLALALPGSPLQETAQAVTQQEIDDLKGDAKDLAGQRKDLKSQLAALKDDKANALRRIELLDEQIVVTEREIKNTEQQIAGYEALLAQTAYELEENRKEEARRYELFCVRTRTMEENGTASYWAVLFNAEDFADLLSRLADIQEVMDYDQSVLDSLRSIRAEIEAKQAYQEELKSGAEAAKLTLEEKKLDLDNQRTETDLLVQEIQSNMEEYQEVLDEVAAEEERIQKEIQELSEQFARENSWQGSVGGYIWPETKSKRITSDYGGRNTGIKGASTNHKGVDIGGVGYDTNVLATKDGKVITSAYSGSYGNYVVISHGTGFTTLYAHMSSRKVKTGDFVTQGTVIGVTGSTGISNGPHIHYEITENGKRVDPKQYLPGWVQAW